MAVHPPLEADHEGRRYARFSLPFVSTRLMSVHPKIPWLTHLHPDPPLEGEGSSFTSNPATVYAQKCSGARKDIEFELRRTVSYVEAQILIPDAADGRFSA